MHPALVFVSGLPASGKTTLARRLSGDLRLSLIARDDIKEALFESLGWSDVAWSRTLGGVSWELLFRFAKTLLSIGISCIVESNFDPNRDGERVQALCRRAPHRAVQVHCVAESRVLPERFSARAISCKRHPGHLDHLRVDDVSQLLRGSDQRPLLIDVPVVTVNTTVLGTVDYDSVLTAVRAAIDPPGGKNHCTDKRRLAPMSETPVVLSHVQATPLLAARTAGTPTVTSSPDLGLTEVEVAFDPDGIRFPTGERVSWADLERIADSPNACFKLVDGEPEEIRVFSEATGWVRSLFPTTGAPTMLVSGIPMHRIQAIDPHQDTLRKIKAIGPIGGVVLDTATGLGYTAIEAARKAERAITIELDPAGLEVARDNPWSRGLFGNPRIEQIVGDAYEEVERFADGTFSRIIHDPPAMALAGELYSGAFYRQLARIMKRNGRLFHYIGDPESASGRNITRGVIRRLQESGFTRIVRRPEAFGVVASK